MTFIERVNLVKLKLRKGATAPAEPWLCHIARGAIGEGYYNTCRGRVNFFKFSPL